MTDIREEVKADILFSSTRMQGFAQVVFHNFCLQHVLVEAILST